MCGRLSQYRGLHEFAAVLNTSPEEATRFSDQPIGRYNVAPSTQVALFHQDDDGLHAEPVVWGWAPHWATGKPPAINARVETVSTGNYFRSIWKTGRALVPADGWYEWKTSPDNPKLKQPYFIRLQGDQPLFFASLGQFPRGGAEARKGDGFVILTGAADAGLTEVHDRKPLVLLPELARAWVDPATSLAEAEDIARYHVALADAFEWFPVSKEVGNVRNDYPGVIEPISGTLL